MSGWRANTAEADRLRRFGYSRVNRFRAHAAMRGGVAPLITGQHRAHRGIRRDGAASLRRSHCDFVTTNTHKTRGPAPG